MISVRRIGVLGLAVVFCSIPSMAQEKPVENDIPSGFSVPKNNLLEAGRPDFDYIKRIEMVPMRDGTKLYTVIIIPKGATHAPIMLERTPYNAAGRVANSSVHMANLLGVGAQVFVDAGYILVYQDVRGKYGSEGSYLMTPPAVKSGFNPTGADDTTDAWDTIDWLVKNVPESNGKVGMIGSSYDGFTVVMALLHPHPALKAAVPESPMVDGWMGDDWFHYGAFREHMLDYFVSQTAVRGRGPRPPHFHHDDYTTFLELGSAGDYARAIGEDQLPYWHTVEQNSAYDAFWQSQALNKLIAKTPLTVPTIWLQGLWDQEDMWGANHSYFALEPQDKNNDMNYLIIGPWRHSQIGSDGSSLGPLQWTEDTTEKVRRNVLLPFFNQYLKDGAPKADTPPVYIYNTGENRWDRFNSWPQSCDEGCPNKSKPLYLAANDSLSFEGPAAGGEQYDEYVSDPAKPVPYLARPIDGSGWRTWLVQDQRFVDGRPDVLAYETAPLTKPVRVSGIPLVNLYASTSGTDSDWVVKVIDVYPEEPLPVPPIASPGAARPAAVTTIPEVNMSGYELAISLDIFRGRFRTSFEHPEALTPNHPQLYKFTLPNVNHVFLPGHRIMVQVQSTLFPLYDRNPQTFVPNIFDAKPSDYQKATQRIWHTAGTASFIEFPVVE
jgi:putative CocE/NonD family hydrolase